MRPLTGSTRPACSKILLSGLRLDCSRLFTLYLVGTFGSFVGKPVFVEGGVEKYILFGLNYDAIFALKGQGVKDLQILDDTREGLPGWDAVTELSGEAKVICGVCSSAQARRRAVEKITRLLERSSLKWEWATVVSPTAIVADTARMGRGVLVSDGAFIGEEAELRDFAAILPAARVHHEVVVGPCSVIVSGAQVLGRVTLGEAVYICANAVVLPDSEVGAESTVGANVVVGNVRPGRCLCAPAPRDITRLRQKVEQKPR